MVTTVSVTHEPATDATIATDAGIDDCLINQQQAAELVMNTPNAPGNVGLQQLTTAYSDGSSDTVCTYGLGNADGIIVPMLIMQVFRPTFAGAVELVDAQPGDTLFGVGDAARIERVDRTTRVNIASGERLLRIATFLDISDDRMVQVGQAALDTLATR